jgi:hypothetical protein
VEPLFGVPQARLVSLVRPRTDTASFLALRLPFLCGCGFLLLVLAAAAWCVWRQLLGPANAIDDVIARSAHANDMHMSVPVAGAPVIRRIGEAINQILKQYRTR